jgi:hypothetical protein
MVIFANMMALQRLLLTTFGDAGASMAHSPL